MAQILSTWILSGLVLSGVVLHRELNWIYIFYSFIKKSNATNVLSQAHTHVKSTCKNPELAEILSALENTQYIL